MKDERAPDLNTLSFAPVTQWSSELLALDPAHRKFKEYICILIYGCKVHVKQSSDMKTRMYGSS